MAAFDATKSSLLEITEAKKTISIPGFLLLVLRPLHLVALRTPRFGPLGPRGLLLTAAPAAIKLVGGCSGAGTEQLLWITPLHMGRSMPQGVL